MRKIRFVMLMTLICRGSIAIAQPELSHKDFAGEWKSEKFSNIILIKQQNDAYQAVFTADGEELEVLEFKPVTEFGQPMIKLSWRNEATDFYGAGDLMLETFDKMKLVMPNPNASTTYDLGGAKDNSIVSYYIL